MRNFLKIFNSSAFQVGLILIIAKYFFDNFFNHSRVVKKSSNSTVNSVINLIDNSLDKWGTFNKDHYPIFKALISLSSSEIRLLHKDFGTRAYNPIHRQYGFSNGFFLSKHKDLNSLFDSEFDPLQLKKIKSIYSEKGLAFPMIS